MDRSPTGQFAGALEHQVPSAQPEHCRPFPPPLGPWLTQGQPANLRATMVRHKITPAGLLHRWLVEWPYRLKVESWGIKPMKRRATEWPKRIQQVYTRDRNAMHRLFEVRGQVSELTRLVCARYGAWRAQAALEIELMHMSELSWAGLAVQVLEAGPIAFCGDDAGGIAEAVDAAGDAWWLLSDNCRVVPKGVASFKASGMMELIRAGEEARQVAWVAKQVFAKRGSRVAVRQRQQTKKEKGK